ncbi:MAG: class I SAM-dependent methyltransferase [Gemmatimonadaceae bacterium]
MLTLEGVKPPRDRGGAERMIGFSKPYLIGLGYSLALFGFGWATRKGRAAIVDFCSRTGYRHDRREIPTIPSVSADSLVGDGKEISLSALDNVDGNVTDRELIVLNNLVRGLHTRSIFELGTFDGRTTRNLAANCAPGGRVWTLDLPRDAMQSLTARIQTHEEKYVDKARSGVRYIGTPEESRIEQLYGDSGTYDFSRFKGVMDFVFVDASHAYRYVVNDSLVALNMLREEGGTIAWHDYGRWDGVTRAVNDLQSRHPDFQDVVQVEGTTLALLQIGSARTTG